MKILIDRKLKMKDMKNLIITAAAAFLAIVPMRGQDAEAQDIVLKNDRVELRFSSSGNTFFFRKYITGDVNILPDAGSTAHPWEITFLGPNGETPVLQQKYTYYKGGIYKEEDGVQTASFTWNIVLESEQWPLTMTVSLAGDADMPKWDISAEMPDGWTVTNIDFPRITVRRMPKGILPFGYGVEYDMPSEGQLQSRYPSVTGMMQMVLMHDGKSTVYFAADDTTGSQKLLTMKGEGDNVVFFQSVETSYAWSEGGKFSLPWSASLAYNPDTWENTAVKWYRPFTFGTEWGRRTVGQRKIAEWVKNADLWLRPTGVTAGTMESLRKALDYYGKGVGLHWYFWHHHDFDTNYPDYFPAKDGFVDMVREAQKLGAYVTPYINGRLWDTDNHTYSELGGAQASCRKPDGTLYTEVYSSKVLNTVTCPASEIWQGVLYDLNRRILRELKTDGVYMDQIGCAASQPCYADNHGHAKGGGGWWPAVYRDLLARMRNDLYRKDKAMTTEENVECYMDLFDMMLVVNSPHSAYQKMVPLFPLIYSDRCIYSGFTYLPWGRINDGSLNYISMKSLLWGSQLGWINPEIIMRPENAVESQFLKTLADFRKGQHDLFLGGRFLSEFVPGGDNPVQDIPNYQKTNVVMGAEWETMTGGKAILLVNMSGQPHAVQLPGGSAVTVSAYGALRIDN